MVVIRTGPGHAQIVALGLDRSELDDAVGTLAGDDTIFICNAERGGGRSRLASNLRELSGIEA